MSWRLALIGLLDILLRVPPLFVLDYVINGSAISVIMKYSQLNGTPLFVLYAAFAVSGS